MSEPTLRLVVALNAEAKPLTERFGLAPLAESHPFRLYRGERGWAIVSGPGKAAAAAATAYLHLISGGHSGQPWLNVGIGGHGLRAMGEGFIAHKIQDAASGLCWYLPLVVDLPCPTAPLLSVERLEEEYSLPWVHENEAAGFYPTACRFSTSELVQCFKVISDNPEATLARSPTAGLIERLITGNLEKIENFANALVHLAREAAAIAADPPRYRELLGKLEARGGWTAAGERRLRRLLQRQEILRSLHLPPVLEEPDLTTLPEELLASWEARLAACAIPLAQPPGARTGAPSHAVR
ncbi:MAG TPA: hypothetical protein VMM92_03185 [Thermoanaerobaculia bacterium]|nr:hypothetical protein [Thermoanaerobaculia bacterium]